MTGKRLVVLAAAAVLVIGGVVGLARLLVPDEPTFTEGFEEASESSEGSLDFMPTAVGGELEITGDREGTISLRQGGDDRLVLLSDDARLSFASNPLALDQMSYEGLEFFPDPDACEFTEGQHNEDLGLAAAQMECSELVDVRDNGSISLQGYIAVPAHRIVDIDVPDTGGTVRVGDDEWEAYDPSINLFQTEVSGAHELPLGLSLYSFVGTTTLFFAYDGRSETFSLTQIGYGEEFGEVEEIEVDPEECSVTTEELVVVDPRVQYHAMDFSCESVDLAGAEQVHIEGSVVFKMFLQPISP